MRQPGFLLTVSCALFLAGCSTGKNDPAGNQSPDSTGRATLPLSAYNYHLLEGLYQGDFGGSNIRLVLSYISGRHATGYTLHKGLRRNFSGTMQPAEKGFSFELNEPGDNPYDGKFLCSVDTGSLALSGSWKPFHADATSPKTYTLRRSKEAAPDSSHYEPTDFTDTLDGRYHFDNSGLITYQTYRSRTGAETQQLQTVRGSWTLNGSTYTVDWGPNDLLPARQIRYRRVTDTADGSAYLLYLEGGGQKLYPAGEEAL